MVAKSKVDAMQPRSIVVIVSTVLLAVACSCFALVAVWWVMSGQLAKLRSELKAAVEDRAARGAFSRYSSEGVPLVQVIRVEKAKRGGVETLPEDDGP